MDATETQVIRRLIETKDWAALKRMLKNLQERGIPNLELVKVANKIIKEAMQNKTNSH